MVRKTEKGGKFRNVHCTTWKFSRKLKIMENEKHPLDDSKNDEINEIVKNEKCTLQDLNMARKLKITENEKYTLWDVKYGEENRKRWKIQKYPLQDVEYGNKTENHGNRETSI